METQLNVAAGDGEPVAERRSTWSNGTDTWHSIRIPKNANSEPTWDDYNLAFSFTEHAEGIGMTGWDWQARRSRWFGFDFDALTSHAKGVGVSKEDLEKVKQAAMQLPWVEVRKSTGGGGIHLYVRCDEAGIPCENHTVHAALARCVLGMMSSECNFAFASQIDCCGGVMWVWHRKMSTDNQGLALIKPATNVLSASDLPANWRDHIEVVTHKRSKVRINEVSDERLDIFETLTSAQTIIPLDGKHKAVIETLQQSGYTTLWVSDHNLLQTHTCALKKLMDEQAKELRLEGVFETNSRGRHPDTPNCFMFPLPNGAWRVYRFSPGVSEAATWSQDKKGWTTCYFNRAPDLPAAAKLHGGLLDPEKKGYTFSNPEDAMKAAKMLGQPETIIDSLFAGRDTTLKPDKDGHLIVEIERRKEDAEQPKPQGWLAKKTKWVRVFETTIPNGREDETTTQSAQYDNVLRAIKTPAEQFVAWALYEAKRKKWVYHPVGNVKMRLQSLGNAKDEAECIMGSVLEESWELVTLPFRDEYPGRRQWNRDAPRFAFPPADLKPDEVPCHPHWDMIFDHLGGELTPVLKTLSWAQKAGIRTGADYLRAWVACAFREPFEPLPYLFMFGRQDMGKSTFHEALMFLVTKGVVQADKVLKTRGDFNGELVGAIICAVEDTDMSKNPEAANRIKVYTTARTLSIREMRMNTYQTPNTTHWVQTANHQHECPVQSDDTRITVIEVCDLLDEQKIAKQIMEARLKEQAPHFLYTLMHLPLPPVIDRLRLPVVTTASKSRVIEQNKDALQQFLDEGCVVKPDARLRWGEFYDAFQETVEASEKHVWSRTKVSHSLPSKHPIVKSHGQRWVLNLALKPPDAAEVNQ